MFSATTVRNQNKWKAPEPQLLLALQTEGTFGARQLPLGGSQDSLPPSLSALTICLSELKSVPLTPGRLESFLPLSSPIAFPFQPHLGWEEGGELS